MFERFKKKKRSKQIILSLGVGISLIAFWRGIWGLMDLYIFPNNYELSLWLSLLAGLAVLYLTHHLIKELK